MATYAVFTHIFLFLLSVFSVLSNSIPPNIAEIITTSLAPDNQAVAALFSSEIFFSETPIVIRYALMLTACRYEVQSGCHPTALGFLGHRNYMPKRFCNDKNAIAIMISTAEYKLIANQHPSDAAVYGQFLQANGLDLFNQTRDVETIPGISNLIADRLIEYFSNDGWNSLGDETRSDYRQAFEDPTGYAPVNKAPRKPENLNFPLRWQPDTLSADGHGRFQSQVHVVPHLGITAKPLILPRSDIDNRKVKSPYKTPNRKGGMSTEDKSVLLKHMEDLFDRSRRMTPRKIQLIHWWNSKIASLGVFLFIYEELLKGSMFEFDRMLLGEMLAQHDAVLVAWKEKRRHDLVRPKTVIRRLLKGKKVQAFKGYKRGFGKVKAEEWEPVVPVQPHSEFPSGSAAVCAANFEHMEIGLKNIFLNGNGTVPPFEYVITGRFLPFTPVKEPVKVVFNTLQEAARSCGESRLDAGVHFKPSVDAGYKISKGIGQVAYNHVTDLVEGRIPKFCPRCIRS